MFLFRFKWRKQGAEKLKVVDLYILFYNIFSKHIKFKSNGIPFQGQLL